MFVAAPEVDVFYVAHERDGLDVSFGLFAGADDREGGGVFVSEVFCGDGAGGGGADGGDLFGVEEHEGCAVVAVEEDDDTLVGGVVCGVVGVEDGY